MLLLLLLLLLWEVIYFCHSYFKLNQTFILACAKIARFRNILCYSGNSMNPSEFFTVQHSQGSTNVSICAVSSALCCRLTHRNHCDTDPLLSRSTVCLWCAGWPSPDSFYWAWVWDWRSASPSTAGSATAEQHRSPRHTHRSTALHWQILVHKHIYKITCIIFRKCYSAALKDQNK